jgi:hypothetical protein
MDLVEEQSISLLEDLCQVQEAMLISDLEMERTADR